MQLLNVLFPKVRAELLRLLFADAQTKLHLRELTRQSGLSLGTVQEELGKLHAADLVTSHRDGNRRYYCANPEHPIFHDLQQIVLKTSGLREVLERALRNIRGIDVAFVFGSLAKSDGKASSDVDLMVIGNAGLRALAPGSWLSDPRQRMLCQARCPRAEAHGRGPVARRRANPRKGTHIFERQGASDAGLTARTRLMIRGPGAPAAV